MDPAPVPDRTHPLQSRAARGGAGRWPVLAVLAAIGALAVAGCGGDSSSDADADGRTDRAAAVVRVPEDAATISQAMERVPEGGMVLVGPGTYREKVLITTPDVTLRGTDRDEVVITGEGERTEAVLAVADGVRIENLTVTETMLFGILVTGAHEDGEGMTPHQGGGYARLDPEKFPPLQRFHVDHVTATNNGLYGIYAFNARHGTISNSWASGSADSGIYVGQCRDCDTVVRGNVATRNAVGFENANASDSLSIVGNRFSGNRVGLTLTSDYQEAFVPQRDNLVAGNVISDNHAAGTPAQADGGFGVGVGIAGGQANLLLRNRITGNPRSGVLLDAAEDIASVDNRFADNLLEDNGVDFANVSHDAAPATGNCLDGGGDVTTLPPAFLAGCPSEDNPATGADALPRVRVPDGASFLDVRLPGPLPSLPDASTPPARVPDHPDHPAPDAIRRPAGSLLADRGARR